MKLHRRLTAVALIALTLSLTACDKNLLAVSNDVISSLRSAQPLIAQLLPKSAPKIDSAITIAGFAKNLLKN